MTPAIHYALLRQSLTAGVSPLGASTSREPTSLLEGTRGEVSTSTAAHAAELDALYHGLPSYQPEPMSGKGIEGTVVTEPSSLPTILVSAIGFAGAAYFAKRGAEGDYQSYFSNIGG